MQLNGSATAHHVIKDKSFYVNNPKEKIIGIMQVNDISNFTMGIVSGRNVVAKWTNPTQTNGRPYSGVYIRYQTGSYPTVDTGTVAYKGIGSSGESGVESQVTFSLPSLSTTYYFICYPYVITSNGEMFGNIIKTTFVTGDTQIVTVTSSQNYTVPAGYNAVDIFCVGGGGGGETGSEFSGPAGYGGGGGYTATKLNIPVKTGEVLICYIGRGGNISYRPSTYPTESKVTNSTGGILCNANPGSGYNGGSGGGTAGIYISSSTRVYGGYGGSNGGDGGNGSQGGSSGAYGRGQGRTTKAFGEANGALYAGGGGGGGADGNTPAGGGGSGGGGSGGHGGNKYSSAGNGGNGAANTGGGGGGGGGAGSKSESNPGNGGTGAMGVVLLRFK